MNTRSNRAPRRRGVITSELAALENARDRIVKEYQADQIKRTAEHKVYLKEALQEINRGRIRRNGEKGSSCKILGYVQNAIADLNNLSKNTMDYTLRAVHSKNTLYTEVEIRLVVNLTGIYFMPYGVKQAFNNTPSDGVAIGSGEHIDIARRAAAAIVASKSQDAPTFLDAFVDYYNTHYSSKSDDE